MAEATEKRVPAYLPYKTLKNFLRTHTQGLPHRFEKSMFRNMSGSVRSQLVQTLRALDLMDANWVPTPKLERLTQSVNDERQYREALHAVLHDAYPFLAGFNIKTATLGMLQEELEGMGASGGTVAKCVAFFIPAVKDAGMEISTFIEKPGTRLTPSGNGRPKRAARGIRHDVQPPPPPPPPPGGQPQAWHERLLAKFPDFDPTWPNEVKSKWFDDFAKLREAGEKESSKK